MLSQKFGYYRRTTEQELEGSGLQQQQQGMLANSDVNDQPPLITTTASSSSSSSSFSSSSSSSSALLSSLSGVGAAVSSLVASAASNAAAALTTTSPSTSPTKQLLRRASTTDAGAAAVIDSGISSMSFRTARSSIDGCGTSTRLPLIHLDEEDVAAASAAEESLRPAARTEMDHAAFSEKRARLLNLITNTSILVDSIRNPPASSGMLGFLTATTPKTSATSTKGTGVHDKSNNSSINGQTTSTANTDNNNNISEGGGYQWELPPSDIPTVLSSSDNNMPPSSSLATTNNEMRILKYDLPKSHHLHHDHSTQQLPTTLHPQFIKSKLNDVNAHLDRLHIRISDTRSRVLVTGDLNAGKSTFVNAMLRREVVPDDQQPCTAVFVEVIDADQNDGIEEVHGIVNHSKYKRHDSSSFTRFDIRHLRKVVEENEPGYELLKVYCRDRRERQQSLLHNGVVDISLIDSPGLNIDSMKTTALFAQQEEIDVIVFVVNAENHFTLSGREFLQIAGREKAYIFIVVNRFDQIKRRAERCRRDILDQILEISPSTYADAPNLVHFVSARQCLQETPENPSSLLDFMSLEDCLRSFILDKRSKSKLAPAKIYLNNVLSDLSLLASHNADQEREVEKVARRDAAAAAPDLHCMQALKAAHVDGLDLVIDAITHQIQTSTLSRLEDWIEGMEAEFEDAVEWPGGFWWFGGGGGPWVYVERLVRVIAECREYEVKECERLAVDLCLYTVNNVEELMRKDMSPSLANTLIGGDECATEEEKSSGGGGHRERFGIDRSLLSAEALFGSGNANNNCNTASLSRDFDMIMEEGNNNNNSSSSMLLAPISSATASGAVGKLSVADRLDFAKEFAPSSAVVLTGVLGYSGLFKSLMRVIRGGVGGVSSSMLTNALEKTLFVGLTIAGVGLFFYAVSDMKLFLYRRIVAQEKSILYATHFSADTTDRIVRTTSKALAGALLLDFRGRFTRSLISSQHKLSWIEERAKCAARRRAYLDKIVLESSHLRDILNEIELD